MRWNLSALLACFVAAHAWLIVAVSRRRGAGISSEVNEFRQTQRAEQQPSAWQKRFSSAGLWLLLAALCAMYAWMAVTAQHLWAANRFEGASPGAMQVEVTGQQFQWYFRYPGEDARFGHTQPQLVNAAAGNPLGLDPGDAAAKDDLVSSILMLPVGREVDLRLRSLDVIHGFFIPAMRLKQNAVPGLVLHVHFTPVTVGTYPILCSQVCGLGHQRMQAQLRVVSVANYQQWIEQRERQRAKESQP